MADIEYRRLADGSFESVERRSDGDIITPVVAPRGGSWENKDGKWTLIADMAEYKRHEAEGNTNFINDNPADAKWKVDPALARLRMRRQQEMVNLLQQTATMQMPPGQGQLKVKDGEFERLHNEYRVAALGFKTPADANYYAENGNFVPKTFYAHKIARPGKTPLRSFYKGEVGMIGSRIVVLEEGYGEGNRVTGGLEK